MNPRRLFVASCTDGCGAQRDPDARLRRRVAPVPGAERLSRRAHLGLARTNRMIDDARRMC
jgi:hypothetical protein